MNVTKRILVFVLMAAFQVGVLQAQNQADITQQLSERYTSLTVMKADFVQVATSDFLDAPERFSGSLTFGGTGYRVETGSQSIITDGTTMWIYNRSQNQVIINDFVEDEYSFSLTTFLRQLDEDFTVTSAGVENRSGQVHDMLDLEPNDEFASFRQVRLGVRRSDGLVTWLKVIDLNDVEMVFDLSNIRVDPPIPDDLFRFEPPSGVEVVDLRG